MRHPLNWILRAAMPEAERVALLGDLEEEYRRAVQPARGRLRAQIWYARELAAACAFGLRDRTMRSGRERAGVAHQNPARPAFRLFGGDVRHALRRWRRRPGFAATAILTLMLGIGTTTALFSIVDAVLLAPPPWPDADRLVAIHAVFPERRQNPASATTWNRGMLSYPAWDALRRDPAFQQVGAWRRTSLDTTFGEARTAMVETMDVSSSFLPLLGIGLSHGRYFTKVEDDAVSDSVILTHEAWQRHYGGRDDIIGLPAILGSASSGGSTRKTVVGVLTPGFAFDGDPVPEFLLPVGIQAEVGRRYPGASLRLVARLASGVSLEAAGGAANAIVRAVEQREPTLSRLVPLLDDQWRGTARPLWVLFGGATLLLLVACSNVAGLLLGEGRARRHEIAVRSALGGSRGRVVRQLVVEHALLAIASAVGGLVLAYWLMQALVAIAPAGLPRLDMVTIDVRVAAFALGLGVLTVLVFGIGPALSLARTPAAEVLARRDPGARRHLAQRAVVTGQIALALVLLVGASLLGDTLFRLASQPLGFNPAGLAIVSFRMTWLPGVSRTPITAEEYRSLTPEQHVKRRQDADIRLTTGWWLHMSGAIARVAALPGIATVGGGYAAPFTVSGPRQTGRVLPAGRPAEESALIRVQSVTDRYFEAMGIRLVRGRTFEAGDRRSAPAIRWSGGVRPGQAPTPIVISRELEQRFFAGNGVGRQIVQRYGDSARALEIIGVVEDVRWRQHAETDAATYYTLGEAYHSINTLVVRAAGDPGAVLPSVREALRAYDPNIVVTSTATMDSLLAQSIADERFRATLSGIFGAAALVLSAVGLYGLCVRRVADRRREIAVRVALGAQPGDVRGLVLGDAWRTVGVGLVVGVPAAIAAVQVTQSILAGVTPATPWLFLIATVVLALAALVAMIHPMRRAAAIDPITVLKE